MRIDLKIRGRYSDDYVDCSLSGNQSSVAMFIEKMLIAFSTFEAMQDVAREAEIIRAQKKGPLSGPTL